MTHQQPAGWLPMCDAPQDGTAIEGYYTADEIVPIRWAEERVCMLAGLATGAGRFDEGWEDVANGLYVDDPIAWRPAARVEHHDLLILSADMAVQAAIVLEEDQ